MVYTGYLEFGGREIVNGDRVSQYVQTMLPSLHIEPCSHCEDLHSALGHKAYTTPLVDQPEWFDPDDPDTWDFYGFYPLSFEGFEDATTTATVTEYIYDGGAVSPPRRGTREMRITGLMIGLTDAAVSKGMTWLRQALMPVACRDGTACTGDHLCYLVACPELCEGDETHEMPSPHNHTPYRECETGIVVEPLAQCTFTYERHLYESTVVDGPKITKVYSPSCGAISAVEFTVVAGVPSPFGTAVRVASGPAANLITVPNLTCEPDAAGMTLLRQNNAINPGLQNTGGWSSADATKFTSARSTEIVRRAGHPSALITLTAHPADPTIFAGATDIGANASTAITQAAVSAGMTYVASVYAWSGIAGRVWVVAQPVTDANVNVGPAITGGKIALAAGRWDARPFVQFVAPANATRVRLFAFAQTTDSSTPALGVQAAFADALVEADWGAPLAYFDGYFPDTVGVADYAWAGTAGASVSTLSSITYSGALIDPGCVAVPSPPRPPAIVESCVEDPATYTRYVQEIPSDAVPAWSDAVPVIRITSGATAVRQLRLRFYTNPFEIPADQLEPCDFCGEFIVSYLPANSLLTLDGIAQTAKVTGAQGQVWPAGHLLYGSGGGPMMWPRLTCGIRYDLMVDISPTVLDMSIDVCLAPRE